MKRTEGTRRLPVGLVAVVVIVGALGESVDGAPRRARRCCPQTVVVRRPTGCCHLAPVTCAAPACGSCCSSAAACAPCCSPPAAGIPAQPAPVSESPTEPSPPVQAPTPPPEPSPEPAAEPSPSAEYSPPPQPPAEEEGWVKLTDGQSFEGWKINESPDSWSMEDGAFVAKGPRSHLFFVGDETPFVNFELKVDCMAKANSNGGIYFHTKYQEEGWPKYGYEAQVNNSYTHDPKKSGSLYGTVDVTEQHIPDDTWWTEHIIVQGKHIVIKLNDKVVVDYTEPDDKPAHDENFERRLGEGTFALQAHDPDSVVYFKNIRVKRLP